MTVPQEVIARKIFLIRGKKVILDRDLSDLYVVKTIALRQQVKRNRRRFPSDFMFQLKKEEAETLVSQNVIPSKRSLGGYLPYAFTEQGVAMLSSVLNRVGISKYIIYGSSGRLNTGKISQDSNPSIFSRGGSDINSPDSGSGEN